jgi:hypothetical protein
MKNHDLAHRAVAGVGAVVIGRLPGAAAMSQRMEDLTGNIIRVVDGLAKEIANRVAWDSKNSDATPYNVELHARQVLIDWFLGEFIPGQKP